MVYLLQQVQLAVVVSQLHGALVYRAPKHSDVNTCSTKNYCISRLVIASNS